MKKLKGSITVEAAFLLPLLMLLLVFVMWLALYLHDRLVIENALQCLYCRAEDYIVYGTEPHSSYLPKHAMTERGVLYAVSSTRTKEEKMEAWLYQELEDRLFLFRTGSIFVEKTGCRLKADAYFYCRRPPMFTWLIPERLTGVIWKRSVLFTVREELTRAVSILIQSR